MKDVELKVLCALNETYDSVSRIEKNALLLKSAQAQNYIQREPEVGNVYEAIVLKLQDLGNKQ